MADTLFQPAEFATFGRCRELPVADMPAEMRQAYDFTKGLQGLLPGPHRIWLANPALSKTVVPTGLYYQTFSSRTKAEIPNPWAGLNGGCLIAPNVLLAVGMAELIWRVDLGEDGGASARIWLQHDSMKNRPGQMKPEQPGANGVQLDYKTGNVYYTTTSQQMMLRVKIDPATQDPVGLPEFIAGDRE